MAETIAPTACTTTERTIRRTTVAVAGRSVTARDSGPGEASGSPAVQDLTVGVVQRLVTGEGSKPLTVPGHGDKVA